VAQDEPRVADNAGKRAQIPEAERRERLTELVLCRTKLSASEALLLQEVFPKIFASHHDQVWNCLNLGQPRRLNLAQPRRPGSAGRRLNLGQQ
jgi:hypothetical protein